MRAYVLDCSTAMAWAFGDEVAKGADQLMESAADDSCYVPWLWPLEVANALLVAERRGRMDEARSTRFLQILSSLPIAIDDCSMSSIWDRVLPLARETGLTSYDASYLDLAMRLGLPLATLDERLRDAATGVGVPLI